MQAFVLQSLTDRVAPKRVANLLIEQQCLRCLYKLLTPNLRVLMLAFVLQSLTDRDAPKRVANLLIEQQCLRCLYKILTP
jgi:hypothetical protein